MVGTPAFDTILEVCGHKHRRIVIATLANQQQSVSMHDLTRAIVKQTHHTPLTETADETITQIQTGLHHVHLPKLAEAEFIRYDSEEQVVEPTAHVQQDDSTLSTILAMDSALPLTGQTQTSTRR